MLVGGLRDWTRRGSGANLLEGGWGRGPMGPGRDDKDEDDSKDKNFRKTLPSSSQKKTPTKKLDLGDFDGGLPSLSPPRSSSRNEENNLYNEQVLFCALALPSDFCCHLRLARVLLKESRSLVVVCSLVCPSIVCEVFEKKVNSEKVNSSHMTFSSKNYEFLFQEPSESESDETTWNVSDFSQSDSVDTEPAGPSKTVSPRLPDVKTTVSEKELTQLAQIRPLIFNYSSQSAMRDCLKTLQKKDEYDIIREFLELEQMTVPDDFNSGNELLNKDKNRYRDILPYDSTRVPLGKNKNYINASYIRIENDEEEYFYIATQGPLPETIEDFWQMVMENNCNVIAMITREIEGGVIKCQRYWPISLKEPLELKHLSILLENCQITQYFIIQIFQIVKKSTGMSHRVKHLQFTKWPDHGTPASADFFIKYVRYVRKSHISGPLVVHCSAGVGRTGVFICVDVVFCAIEKNLSFNIMNIVTQMRKQRCGMIQTKEQYHFCYEIVLEVLQNLLALS